MTIIAQDMVLMRALRDMNLPKFVFEDVPLFLGLIGDLFPGLDCPRVRYPKFNDAVEAALVENKYILLPHQVIILHLLMFFITIALPRQKLTTTITRSVSIGKCQ